MDRKGQAAMEFLMTYGWAILAAIIAIGVLAYFGVFSPGRLAGTSSTISPPFFIDEAFVNSSGVSVEMVQSSGEAVSILTLNITGTGSANGVSCQRSYGTNHSSGVQSVFHIGCTSGTLTAGGSFTGDIWVDYRPSGSTFTQRATGTIRNTIQ